VVLRPLHLLDYLGLRNGTSLDCPGCVTVLEGVFTWTSFLEGVLRCGSVAQQSVQSIDRDKAAQHALEVDHNLEGQVELICMLLVRHR
jgi:hypothetical protein